MIELEQRLLPSFYRLADLGPGHAYGMNGKGQVVGETLNHRAYVWDGKFTDLGEGWANDVNDAGVVAGASFVDGRTLATIWQAGESTLLEPVAGIDYSVAQAISETGVVVGHSFDVSTTLATMWVSGEPLLLDSTIGSRAAAVSADGRTAVGIDGFPLLAPPVMWTHGATLNLGSLETGWGGMAMGINDAGTVVGWGIVDESPWLLSRPWRWTAGNMTELETPSCGADAAAYGHAKAINAGGLIVGMTGCVEAGTQGIDSAVVWRQGEVEALTFPAWKLTNASAANDAGQIVGWGIHAEQVHGYLLTPFVIDPVTGAKIARKEWHP